MAKVLSMGFVVRTCFQCSAGKSSGASVALAADSPVVPHAAASSSPSHALCQIDCRLPLAYPINMTGKPNS